MKDFHQKTNNRMLPNICRMLPVVPFLSAFTLGLSSVSHAEEGPKYDLSKKELNEGVLDYLRRQQLIDTIESSFTLSDYTGKVTNPKDLPPGVVMNFIITDTVRYYDPDTGLQVDESDLDPDKKYSKVTVKSYEPTYFELDFKKLTYGYQPEPPMEADGELPPAADLPGDGDDAPIAPAPNLTYYKQPVNVLGKTYTFTYAYAEGAENVYVGNDDYSITCPTSGSIVGDFIDNHRNGSWGSVFYLYSGGDIDSIEGVFINNSSTGRPNQEGQEGGAIWFYADNGFIHIGEIKADFIGNYLIGNGIKNRGGAVLLGGGRSGLSVDRITGHFIGNHVDGAHGNGLNNGTVGGALYVADDATVGTVHGDFIGNYCYATVDSETHGGAIYNGKGGQIDTIIGDFIGNYCDSTAGGGLVWGGAITNQAPNKGAATINTIVGDFIGNYITNKTGGGGGAIYNNRGAYIGTIVGNFIGNYGICTSTLFYADDFPDDKIKDEKEQDKQKHRVWDEDSNTYETERRSISGGAIYNYLKDGGSDAIIDKIYGSFYGNHVIAMGTATAQGGAIANFEGSEIHDIFGDFIGNYATSVSGIARGGAIFSDSDDHSVINKIVGNFYENYVESKEYKAYGGAIRNQGTIERIENSVFVGNTATSYGYSKEYHTARDNYLEAYRAGDTERMRMYRDEYDKRDTYKYARGGAIFNQKEKTLTIAADNGTSLFEGNWTVNRIKNAQTGEVEDVWLNEAIYADTESTLNLETTNFGHIIFNDMINGDSYYVNISGDSTSYVIFNNAVNRATITLDDTNLILYLAPPAGYNVDTDSYLPDDVKNRYEHSDAIRQSLLNANSGTVILSDGKISEYLIGTLKAKGSLFTIDVDFTTVDLENRALADVLTVFGVKDSLNDDPLTKWKDDGASLSEGKVTLQLSIKGPENWSKEEEIKGNSMKNKIVAQVINFVVMEGVHGKSADAEFGMEYYEDNFKNNEKSPIQIENTFDPLSHAYSKMYSSDILAESIDLTSTKTYHDSLQITGWRDNLAAWAEMTDTGDGEWLRDIDNKEDVVDFKDSDQKKLFIIEAVTHYLSRDTEKENGEKTGSVWGKDWTIAGLEKETSSLDLQEHNLLTKVTEEQTAALRNLTLLHVQDDKILNEGNLTLDSMILEDDLKIQNENKLTLNGNMTINNTITSSSVKDRQLVINDMSEVTNGSGEKIRTNIVITGVIEHQNIIHEAATSVWNSSEDFDYSTVTHLQANEVVGNAADGSPIYKETEQFSKFQDNSLTMNGGMFRLYDLDKSTLKLRELHVQGGVIYVDSSRVYLNQQKMGSILANKADYTEGSGGIIWLNSLTIVTDSASPITHVRFVDAGVSDAVKDGLGIAGGVGRAGLGVEVEGPKWTYYVTYNNKALGGGEGMYTFVREGASPAILPGAIAQQTAFSQMMVIYDYSFMHADLYADSVYRARQARLYESSYAVVSPVKGAKEYAAPGAAASAAPDQNYMPIKGGMWLRPYTSFEKIPLHNGPKVDASFYGALVGYDTDLTEHKNGWASVFTGYLGYTGSQQKWKDTNRTRTNGAVIGITETLYKNNFYTAITLSAGASRGEAHTKFGKEDFDMQTAGIASRTGYSIHIADGKYVIQPSLLLSYTYFHVNDYDNASGIHMESDPMHAIQIHPFVKFIKHTETEWKPYLTGGFVWNLMNKTRFKADGEKLPELSIRPYAEYSLGIQKTWKDRYTFYGQATGRSGGRNGVELSAGVRWAW